VGDVLELLRLPTGRRLIVGRNGELASADTRLTDGDRLDVLTPMAGGGR
jgi:sulfur carrier protein ThiS